MNTHPTVMRANSGANQVKCCAICLGHSMSHRTNSFMNAPKGLFMNAASCPSAQAGAPMVHMSKTGKLAGLFPPKMLHKIAQATAARPEPKKVAFLEPATRNRVSFQFNLR
jgi:hypothetical protein